MASDIFRQILGRAILDPSFRQVLLTDPTKILIGLNLGPEEAQALRQLTPQQLDGLQQSVRQALDGMGADLGKHKDFQQISDLLHKNEALIKGESFIKGEDFIKGESFIKGEGLIKGESFFIKGESLNLIKGESFFKLLEGAMHKDEFFWKLLGHGVIGPSDSEGVIGPSDSRPRTAMSGGLQRILIGLSLIGILIGLLLFLPTDGLMPMMGLGNIQPTSGELPDCPEETEDGWLLPAVQGAEPELVIELPLNFQFMLVLNNIRSPLGAGMCATGEHLTDTDGGPLNSPGQTTGGQSTGGQTTGGGTDTCECQATDYVCKKADGSVSYSYNSAQCGGGEACECRGTTYVCPDGTFAEFNPNCGVGGTTGGQCTCICDVPDPQNPGKCLQGHNSCTQQACLP